MSTILLLTRAAKLLEHETALVRLHDAIEAESETLRFGRNRLTVRNMLALVVVAGNPGRTAAVYVAERQMRALDYHLGVLRDRGYLLAQSSGGRTGYCLYLSTSGKSLCGRLELLLRRMEEKSPAHAFG